MKAVTDSATVVYTQQFSCYAVHTPMHMHLHTKAAWFECMSWGCVCDGACGGAQFNISVLVGFKCTFDKRSLVSKVSIRMYLSGWLGLFLLLQSI